MGWLEQLTCWLQSVLTRWFIRIGKRSDPEEVEELSLLDEDTTVYPFYGHGSVFAQVTPFGTIIWNKTRTEKLSTEAKRLVLRHECSHRDRNPVYKGIFLGMAVTFAGGAFLLLLAMRALILGSSTADLVVPTVVVFGMMATFVCLNRIEETVADYHALCELGEESFLEAYEEITTMSDDSFLSRFARRALYTHPKVTVRLSRLVRRSFLA